MRTSVSGVTRIVDELSRWADTTSRVFPYPASSRSPGRARTTHGPEGLAVSAGRSASSLTPDREKETQHHGNRLQADKATGRTPRVRSELRPEHPRSDCAG